ncbi:MAG: hypothetical protein AB7G17_13375 [Phycisphaerales bacterium]
MQTAGKLLRLAERGSFSKIVSEVGRTGAVVGEIGPGGMELAALGLAVGRASEVSYEVTAEVEGLLCCLERAWEERARGASASTLGLVVRGVASLVELCERCGASGEVSRRAGRLLDAACAGVERVRADRGVERASVGSRVRTMGAGGERALRAWERSRRAGSRAA